MLWIDWALLALVFASMGLSLWRGFVHEAIALSGWILAFFLARFFHVDMAAYLADAIQPEPARRAVAWVGLFLFVLLLAHVLAWLARLLINKTPLAWPDRLLGMGFGFLRGLAMCAAFVVVARAFTRLPEQPWWQQSKMLPPLQTVADWFLDVWHLHQHTLS